MTKDKLERLDAEGRIYTKPDSATQAVFDEMPGGPT